MTSGPGRAPPGLWLLRSPRRRLLVAGLGTALLVLIAVTAAVLSLSRGDDPPPPAAGVLPAGMAGTWTGAVTQGPVEFGTEIVLRGGGVGQIVGTSDYPADGCAAELRLLEVGADRITVQERLTRSGALCRGADRLVLALRRDGRLAYTYPATGISSAGTGLLTRG